MKELDERIVRIEEALADALPEKVSTAWLARVAGDSYSDVSADWADAFLEPGRELLRRGGKRWRPLVTILTCEALGGGRRADRLSVFTEIPHNGSLIIDDIEDASLTRRGGLAIHKMFGEDMAINMGNLMYFLPSIVLEQSDFDEHTKGRILQDWLAVMRCLHLGQGYDILWHRRTELFPDENSYLTMCRYKTGSLASLAAILGARAAIAISRKNLTEEPRADSLAAKLGKAWESLGMGFQILDDVQNLSTGIPGKQRGDDIVEGKKSLPVILHATMRPQDTPRLVTLFEKAASETPHGEWSAVENAIGLIGESGAIEQAREKGRDLLREGKERIVELLPSCEERRLMLALVDGFVGSMF